MALSVLAVRGSRSSLRKPEENFGRSVESRLNVSVDSLALVACGPEVDNLDDRTLKAGKVSDWPDHALVMQLTS